MLNEIREYEQYTCHQDPEKPEVRLKHKTLCHELSGIARAMTIIARRSLFAHDDPERIERAKNDLRVWCGDPSGEPEKASEGISFAWLPDYMAHILGEAKVADFECYLAKEPGLDTSPRYLDVCAMLKDISTGFISERYHEEDRWKELLDTARMLELLCIEVGEDEQQRKQTKRKFIPIYNVIKTIDELISRYSKSGYNKALFDLSMERVEKNDFKKIMYDKIIADALMAGPLKRYYLVCENPDLAVISNVTEKKVNYPFTPSKMKKGKWSSPTKRKADLIMKTIAAFLLEQKARDAEKLYDGPVPINITDVKNWLEGKAGTEQLYSLRISDRPLFTFYSIENVAAVSIDSKWMRSCAWNIVQEDDLDGYIADHPDAVYYSDFGAGSYLRKQVPYKLSSAYNLKP